MLAYGSGLRIGEIVNLRVEDIYSKKMRIFVREWNKERFKYRFRPISKRNSWIINFYT